MSGIIGHTMYAILANKEAAQRKLPIAKLIERNYASYLCGAYLGCDIQTMPECVCIDTDTPVGYGTVPLSKSPLTGGAVRPWTLHHNGNDYRPRDIHRAFYGRAHLVFGWTASQRIHTVPWDHLPDYCASTIKDTVDLYGPGERQIAFLFGWIAHIVSDSLIKSVQPGVDLVLLDGKYTATNRPIQDLVTYHDIGVDELGLNWAALLTDLAETPFEPIQLHYMRVSEPRGALFETFPDGWAPQHESLLKSVLTENRRYQRVRTSRLLKQYELHKTAHGWQCSSELQRQSGGYTYDDMVGLARRAGFRHALCQVADGIVTLFEQVIQRYPSLKQYQDNKDTSWEDMSAKWKHSN
jgi:hypothetical protein